jgi:hypothetical protein
LDTSEKPTGVDALEFEVTYDMMMKTHLSNDDDVCPIILDVGGVKTTLSNGNSIICDRLREHISHSSTRLNSLELADTRGPFRMSKECTGEDTCPRSDPVDPVSNSFQSEG